MDLSSMKWLSSEELARKIEEQEVKTFVQEEVSFWSSNDCSKISKEWLSWCNSRKNDVRVSDNDIPSHVAPKNMKVCLHDMKIKSRGPDDAVYNKNELFRKHVARGNAILYMHDLDSQKVEYDCGIFALRKFTGGMGDEDEDQPESNQIWLNYFIKPLAAATQVVCTEKANGEAAHLAARFIKGQWFLILGSKNVHLMIGKVGDLDEYKDSRYLVAKQVGEATLNLLSSLAQDQLEILLNFLHHTKATGVFEVLQPTYQHVVDLSYLEGQTLKFITWTSAYKNESDLASFCSLRPDKAISFAASLGIETVKVSVIPAEQAELRMNAVRQGHGYEGEVFYFLDGKGHVIGLLKKKTAWYVLARAIREKATAAVSAFNKDKSEGVGSRVKKCENRLHQIQTWIGFPDSYLQPWLKLAQGFLAWLHAKVHANQLATIKGNFPALWTEFLSETHQSDRIEWT